jgi:hypothetical protein
MKSEETLNGTIYKHQSGSSALKTEDGLYNVYDSNNKLISKVKTEEEVASVLERNFNKEALESDKNIKTGIEIQRKKQANFKVIDSETRAEAEKSGSIFNTQWGREFTSGTEVIPQTREEFILSSMVKLRQSNLKTVVDVFKAKSREINILKQQLEQAKQAKIDAWNRHKQLRTKASKDLYNSIDIKVNELKASISKYDVIDYAVRTDESKGANGQHILDVLNNLRENGEAYRNVGRMLFGDIENSQYQTGKPITVVATHGTNSDKLLKTMEFDSKYLGENGRHGDANDSIGAFLAGSEETSRFYSEPSNLDGKPDNKLRQVRALVKMENPLVVDVNYRSFDKDLYKNIFNKAKADGHDGVVIQNVYDGGNPDTVYVAMSDKLKSNTAIIDTVESTNPNFFEANRPSTPRGTETLSDLRNGSFKPDEDYSTERAYNARVNQPMKLWNYPVTENFKKWAGNLPLIKDVLSQSKPESLENGFVTTVYKGVGRRDFDTFKGRNLNSKGEAKDSYGRIIKDADKDPNYFISEYKPASVYATDVISYEKKYPKMFKNMVEKRGLSNGKADMYYVRSENPAVFTNITKNSKIYSDLYNWWKENIKDVDGEDYLKNNPKRYSKFVEYNFDAFVDMINKGEFRENKHWEQTEGGVNYWQDFAKDFLNKGYDSVVIKDTTTHKSTPTIIIDQGSTNVKASSNYGDFSSIDNRYNFKPSEEVGRWKINKETGSFDLDGKPTNVRFADPSKFAKSALEAKQDSKFGTSVDVQTADSYKEGNYTLIMAGDGLAHASISADGELGSVVKGKNGTTQDVDNVVRAALATGKVKWLNGFDTILPEKYSEFGFEAVARIPFNEEYMPTGWSFENYKKFNGGRPDVVFMSYKGDEAKPYSQVKESIPKVEGYDEAAGIAKEQNTSNFKPSEQQMKSEFIGKQAENNPSKNTRYKVSEEVKRGVSSIDSTIAKINKVSVVSSVITNALDDFKEALRKQDATDEIVVKEVEETHSALLDVLNNEIKSSSNATKPYLFAIKEKVKSLDRRLEKNSNRINTKIEKQKQKRHENLQRDLDEGADLDLQEMLAEEQRKEDARINYQEDMQEGADIESEQLIEEKTATEEANFANARMAEQTQQQAQPLEQPINQRDVWRRYVSEKTPNGSITKNSAGFSIILNGTKLRVYNPQNVLLGIYTDLEQAKRRVQREEPKQL